MLQNIPLLSAPKATVRACTPTVNGQIVSMQAVDVLLGIAGNDGITQVCKEHSANVGQLSF